MADEKDTAQTEAQEKESEKSQNNNDKSKNESVALNSFYGVKAGMTRIFDKDGVQIPVTVVKLIPNHITQVKNLDKDGYLAYQVGFGEKRENLISKPLKGHLAKSKVGQQLSRFYEIKVDEASPEALGKEVSIDEFSPNTNVDVTGTSKGKGFQGVIKRYNFSGGPASHGSKLHRSTGSVGNGATPGKIRKNRKMPGHMGSEKVTVQNLKVVKVDKDKGYMLLRGAVPGSKNSFVRISKAIKG